MAPHSSATTIMAPTRSFRDDKNGFHSHQMVPHSNATTTRAPTRSSRANKQDRQSYPMVSPSHATTKMASSRRSRYMQDLLCHMCSGKGHYPWECPNPLCKKCNGQVHKSWECNKVQGKVVKRRAMMIKLQSLLPPPSMQVHLWRRPWRRRR